MFKWHVTCMQYHTFVPSVLWRCWFGNKKDIRPVLNRTPLISKVLVSSVTCLYHSVVATSIPCVVSFLKYNQNGFCRCWCVAASWREPPNGNAKFWPWFKTDTSSNAFSFCCASRFELTCDMQLLYWSVVIIPTLWEWLLEFSAIYSFIHSLHEYYYSVISLRNF